MEFGIGIACITRRTIFVNLVTRSNDSNLCILLSFLCKRISGIEILDDNAICNILPDWRVNTHLHLLSRVLTRLSFVHIVSKNNA